ncbi:MAG: hypothetical protein QXZ17_10575 [Nitrososphaerota archaeon]
MGSFSYLVFVFGTPGVRISKVAKQIKNKQYQDLEVIDFEDDYFKKKFKEKYGKSFSSMGEVIGDYPQSVIKEIVKDALKALFENIQNDKTQKKAFVVFAHLEYYSNRTAEYYSAWDSSMFFDGDINKLTVSKIILLVDDVYDMFIDLWGDLKINNFNIYSYNRLANEFLKRIKQKDNPSNDQERALKLLEAKYSALSELLFWRESELTLARSLSDALKLEFHIFGVKNKEASFLGLINGKLKTVYLSHVISDFRSQRRASNEWPPIVHEINQIPTLFANDLVILAPTSIDELRLDKLEPTSPGPGLLERWPFEPKESLYIPPECNSTYKDVWGKAPNFYNLLDLDFFDDTGKLKKLSIDTIPYQDTINSLREILKYQISNQITSRDLAIIETVSGLIVYRGLAGKEKNFSTGVTAEIQHWENIIKRNEESKRERSIKRSKIAFIHFEQDILDKDDQKFKDYCFDNRGIIIDKLSEYFQEIEQFDEKDKSDLFKLLIGDRSSGSGPLTSMEMPNNVRRFFNNNKGELIEKFVKIVQEGHQSNGLSFDHLFDNLFKIFVFKNWEDFKSKKNEVADFISS